MKKLLSILLAVTFVLSMVTVVSANDMDLYKYENYLGKSNIAGESATDIMPWNFCYAWQGLSFETDTMKIVKGNAYSGNYSLYVNHGSAQTASNEMGYHYENMHVLPADEKNFELSFWAKFDSVDGLTLGTGQNRLVIFENNVAKADSRNTTDNVTVTTGETKDGWTKYICNFKRDWNSANISFNIDVASGKVVEDFYIDEIRFKNVDDDVEYIKANGWCYGGGFEYVEEWPVFRGEYLGYIGGGWQGSNFVANTGILPAHNFIEVSDDYASDGDKSAHVVWSLRDTDYQGGSQGKRLLMTHGTSIFEPGKVYKIVLDVKLIEGDLRALSVGSSVADSYFVGIQKGVMPDSPSSSAESGYDTLGSGSSTAIAGAPEGWQRYEIILPTNRPSKGTGAFQIRVYNRQVNAYVDNISVSVKNGDNWDAVALGDGSFESVGGSVDKATFSSENIVAGDITVSKSVPYQIMNVTRDAMMSVVLYKDGRVFDIETVDASSYTGMTNKQPWTPSATITVPDDVDAHDYYIKAMVWGRGTGMSPLSGVDTLYEAAAE